MRQAFPLEPDRPRTEADKKGEVGVHMALDRPVRAPEAADGTAALAVALHIPLASAVQGNLAQMFTPPDKGM